MTPQNQYQGAGRSDALVGEPCVARPTFATGRNMELVSNGTITLSSSGVRGSRLRVVAAGRAFNAMSMMA